MMSDFEKVYPMFDVDERVKVVVSTGAGKTFCAGVDLDIGSMAARRESWTIGIGMFGICSDEMICGLREFEVVEGLSWRFTVVESQRLLRCKALWWGLG
jgi:hypothetical protein